MAKKTKEMEFVYIQPASHKQIGHLESGDKVIQGQVTLSDSYRIDRETLTYTNSMKKEVNLHEGVDLEAMVAQTLINAQILSSFMKNMDVPHVGMIDDIHEDPED